MPEYPYLSLNHVAIDPELVHRFPRSLAYYHLALPIARDENKVTVVMAFPDNRAVVGVLQAILQAEVVPVQGDPQEIRAALDRLYTKKATEGAKRLLCRGIVASAVGWIIAGWLQAELTEFQDSGESLADFSVVASEGQYDLIVVDRSEDIPWLLRNTSTPLLLVRHPIESMSRLLVILRGHSPDQHVLDWAVQLGVATTASVTLMMASSSEGRKPSSHELVGLLTADTRAGEHVVWCARQVAEAGLSGLLKLRQGKLDAEVGKELGDGKYDLVAVAAEAYGDVIQRILTEIEHQSPGNVSLILIVKPRV